MSDPGYGGHRRDKSMSGGAILAAFLPTFVAAVVYVAIFFGIRNYFRKIYAPRVYLSTIPEKDRTRSSQSQHWTRDFVSIKDSFVLQHNSLDAYLYLRFLRLIIAICFVGCCITWPILIPVNATGGGNAHQLDKISFSNIAKNDRLYAHTVVAGIFFGGIMLVLAWERLKLVGIRQACYLNEAYASRLSSKTVLFMNAPREACDPANLQAYFGDDALKAWPVVEFGDLEDLVASRKAKAMELEVAEYKLLMKAARRHRRRQGERTFDGSDEAQTLLPDSQRPTRRQPPVIGSKVDKVSSAREQVQELSAKIEAQRAAPSRNLREQNGIFVAFKSQAAAHRAFQRISFQPRIPLQDRYLAPRPKEILWKNVTLPTAIRVSKATLALAFVIVFTIFFSIPTGIIGSISNISGLADRFSWLAWVNDLPPVAISLISGLLPPSLVSYFVSYVPKLFRHIAKLSGEPTTAQAELKTQAWYFTFQVVQVFLITTFSSGVASVASQIARQPDQTPRLLAENLPKASNFYLTYFILQGTTSAASNLLNYSDLFQYLFYEYFWDVTPRQQFDTYATMKGTPWASWFPKFTNLLVIAIAYACIAPLVLGFATVGIFLYYLSYRYNLLYVRQTKTDTRGEAYCRALKQIPTGIYLAELCLIGLFSARKAVAPTAIMITFLVLTAIFNLLLDRTLRPLETLLGLDIWEEQERSTLAREDGIDANDEQALHAAAHGRRLGLKKLPDPVPRALSDFFDAIISSARKKTASYLDAASSGSSESSGISDDAMRIAYTNPCFTAEAPQIWLPRDLAGVSREEIELNEASGITTTDEAAEIDDKGKMRWNHDLEKVPIFSRPRAI